MSENNKIGTYKFVAEPFHVDFTGRLTMGVLGNHLLIVRVSMPATAVLASRL